MAVDMQKLVLEIEQHVEIDAAEQAIFAALIRRLGEANMRMDGEPMPMVLEARPGGRWYRDLGNDSGHLWGFVQVIKPPTLLEIWGPLFMSYPVAGHLTLRISASAAGSKLMLRHRALGTIDDQHRKGLSEGWKHLLELVKQDCAK